MSKSKKISRFEELPHSKDYAWLKERGIELIQEHSGRIWTDYNAHDPGITILEHLCYLLTEVGYRIHYPMRDILAPDHEILVPHEDEKAFFTAREILTNTPFTLSDIRASILDIKGIRNAGVEKVNDKERRYKVWYILEEGIPDKEFDRYQKRVKSKLLQYRNLGEDFAKITRLKPQEVDIKAAITIDPEINPNQAMAKILATISTFLNPDFYFYSLQELLALGYKTEEIFEGPTLDQGFLLKNDLDRNWPQLERLNPNALKTAVQEIDEVLWVDHLDMALPNAPSHLIAPETYPVFKLYLQNVETSTENRNNFRTQLAKIELQNAGNTAPIKASVVRPMVENLVLRNIRAKHAVENLSKEEKQKRLDLPIPEGKNRKLANYYSIQHEFPRNYQLFEKEDDLNLDESGRGHILQLRAYLTFFEQFVYNYLQLLNSIKYFFKIEDNSPTPFISFKDFPLLIHGKFELDWDKNARTYSPPLHLPFSFIPESIPEFWKLINQPDIQRFLNEPDKKKSRARYIRKWQKAAKESYHNAMVHLQENKKDSERRLSLLLDQFLSTVGFQFDQESFRQYSFFNQNEFTTRTNWFKRRILLNYPAISSARSTGFNYTKIYQSFDLEESNSGGGGASPLMDFKRLKKLLSPKEQDKTSTSNQSKFQISLGESNYAQLASSSSYDELIDLKNYLDQQSGTPQQADITISIEGDTIKKNEPITPERNRPQFIDPFNVSGAKLRICHLLAIDYWQNWRLTSFIEASVLTHQQKLSFPNKNVVIDRFKKYKNVILGFSFESASDEESKYFQALLEHGIEKKKYQILKEGDKFSIHLFHSSIFSEKKQFASIASVEGTTLHDPAHFDSFKEAMNVKRRFANLLKEMRAKSEGFYEVEGILLESTPLANDPSPSTDLQNQNRVYYVFPTWPSRFQNEGFKKILLTTIDREVPAHIEAVTIWLDFQAMKTFENKYHNWLTALAQPQDENTLKLVSQDLKAFLKTKKPN